MRLGDGKNLRITKAEGREGSRRWCGQKKQTEQEKTGKRECHQYIIHSLLVSPSLFAVCLSSVCLSTFISILISPY